MLLGKSKRMLYGFINASFSILSQRGPKKIVNKKLLCQPFVITFVGDTSLCDNDLHNLDDKRLLRRLKWWPSHFYRKVESLTSRSDFLIANLETVLENEPATEPFEGKKYLKWDQPRRTLKMLKRLGVSAVALANNHIMDFRAGLMLKTIRLVKEADIRYLGAGPNIKEASAPLKLKLKGEHSKKEIYIFNAMRASKRYRDRYRYFADKESPGVNPIGKRLYRSITRLRRKKPKAIIIVCPHWQGLDYRWPSKKVLRIGEKFIDSGADFVIGHGAHTIQQIERYRGSLITYSIGNFIFNTEGKDKHGRMEAPPYSVVVRLLFNEDKDNWRLRCKLYFIVTDNQKQDYKVRPVDRCEAQDAFSILKAHASDPEKFNDVFVLDKDERGWHLSWGESAQEIVYY